MKGRCVAKQHRYDQAGSAPALVVAAIAVCAAVFAAGFWLGRVSMAPAPVAAVEDAPAPEPHAGTVPTPRVEVLGLIERRRFAALSAWSTERSAEIRAGLLGPSTEDLLAALEAAARAGYRREAARWLQGYLELVPDDLHAVFRLADMHVALEAPRRSIPYLLAALAGAVTQAEQRAVEARLDEVIGAHAAMLAARQAHAELLAFYEEMLVLRPHADRYRVGGIRALLSLGETERAERLLAETGNLGVDEATLEQLAGELELARFGLRVQRQGGVMLTEGLANGQPVRLMIDTGATHSALSTGRLRVLGARRDGDRVRVLTAGGVVEAPRFVLAEFSVAGRRFADFSVLGLDQLPAGVDGLVGMDVLDRIGWAALPAP